jgi:2-polyprenyl-3-methyl-5-hydroxy-6-metoxy-1,4-benzoquinol methylase
MPELNPISIRNIEINSCGPFVHARYEVDGVTLSQEGPLAGRADFLADSALSTLLTYKLDTGVEILDIGSYDGWILNQIYNRGGFKNLIGIEPRRANIDRGLHLRSILKIEDPARHLCGTLDDSENLQLLNRFEFVTCFGVIHHLNDLLGFLIQVSNTIKSDGYLLLECLTLKDDLVTSEIQAAIEPKDIIYEGTQFETSIIGVKLESNYYPGSASQSGTVQIPTRKTLSWLLAQAGFEILNIKAGWNENNSSNSLTSSHRKEADSTIILARRLEPGIAIKNKKKGGLFDKTRIFEIERIFTYGVLDGEILRLIEDLVLENPDPYNSTLKNGLEELGENLNSQELKVVKALINEPLAKLKFEQAKLKLHQGALDDAREMFIDGVTNLSSDWRSVYRSFFLLANIDVENSSFWLEHGIRCNSEFPTKGMKSNTFYLSATDSLNEIRQLNAHLE